MIDFKGEFQSGGSTIDGPLVAKLIREELVKLNRTRIVERELLQKVLVEKKLEQAGITRDDSPAGALLEGVDYLLGGNIEQNGEILSINGRLIRSSSGVIEATERISFHEKYEIKRAVKNLAVMLASNFGDKGEIIPKKEINGRWEPFSSDDCVSKYNRDKKGEGVWFYKVKGEEDSYAGIAIDLAGQEIAKQKLYISCSSEKGFPVYLRFYSFVPGFSKESADDTLVPVEKVVDLNKIVQEIPADYRTMKVPDWWRQEQKAPNVAFDPNGISYFELEAVEKGSGKTIKDKVRIIRLVGQQH